MRTFVCLCALAMSLAGAHGQFALSLSDLGFNGRPAISNVFGAAGLTSPNDATAVAAFDGAGRVGALDTTTFATLPTYGGDDIFALNRGQASASGHEASISGGSIADVNGNTASPSGFAAQSISARGDRTSASSLSAVGFADLPQFNGPADSPGSSDTSGTSDNSGSSSILPDVSKLGGFSSLSNIANFPGGFGRRLLGRV